MARAKNELGWALKNARGVWYLRYKVEGRRTWPEVSTGIKGPENEAEARRVAARMYADWKSGGDIHKTVPSSSQNKLLHPATKLAPLGTDWVTAIRNELGRKTDKLYLGYVVTWTEFFVTLGNASDTASIGRYQRHRLGEVKKSTVQKERSALLRFLTWLHEQGYIAAIPLFPKIARKATGKAHPVGRRGKAVELSADEALAIIAALPEWSQRSSRRAGLKRAKAGGERVKERVGERFPVRARFEFAHATALRPITISLLEWRDLTLAGLHIRGEIDKNNWDRVVPLTGRAKAALESLPRGEPHEPIFGDHDYRLFVKKAGKEVLKDGPRSEHVTPYVFKHARATEWFDADMPITGVRFISCTKYSLENYVHSSRRAAERIVSAEAEAEALCGHCVGVDGGEGGQGV